MWQKRVKPLLAAVILIIGSTCMVNAKTVQGEYAGGTFEAMLDIGPMYAAVGLSYQPESPSDALYTMVNGVVLEATGDNWIVGISGYNGCYHSMSGLYVSGNCNYVVGTTTVASLQEKS